MRRGFLKTQRNSFGSPKPSSAEPNDDALGISLPEPHTATFSVPMDASPTTISTEPLIVCSDSLLGSQVAHILYVPPTHPQIAIVDTLSQCRDIAKWEVWRTDIFSTRNFELSGLFTVVDIVGKGRGVVASNLITAGSLIISEPPTFVINSNVPRSAAHTHKNGILHNLALSGLASERQHRVYALKNAFPNGPHNDTVGRLSTNYLTIDLAPSPDLNGIQDVSACFETLSLANHSCSPNANYFFDFKTFSGQLWAMRDIKPGEEITIMYTHILMAASDRKAQLERLYRFNCTCTACSAPEPIRKQSDIRRKVLAAIDANADNPNGPNVDMQRLSEAVTWAQDEECWVCLVRLKMIGGVILGKQMKFGEASKWIMDARDGFSRVEGKNSYNVEAMDQTSATLRLLARFRH